MSIFGKRKITAPVSVPTSVQPPAPPPTAPPRQPGLSFTGDEFVPPMVVPVGVAVKERVLGKDDLFDNTVFKVPVSGRHIRYVDHYCPSLLTGWVDAVLEPQDGVDAQERLLLRLPYVSRDDVYDHRTSVKYTANTVNDFFGALSKTLVLSGGAA